jgi:predicted MFS family arabinose efflux permease
VRRLVLLAGAIVLVDTMFFAAITPLLPKLVDELDLGKNGAGVLTGSYAAGSLVGSLPAGWLVARTGVKASVIVGLTLMAASGLAFAFGGSAEVLDGARFLQGVGGACSWAAAMAWITTEAPRERRGQLLGGVIASAILGVQLGPVIGAVASAVGRAPTFSSTVAFAAILCVAAWRMPVRAAEAETPATPGEALRDRRMLAGMWLTALPGAAFGVMDVLAPLRLDALGASALALGVTFFAAAGVEGVLNPLVGRHTDRRGMRLVVRGGLAATAVALVAIQLPGSALALALAVVAVSGLLGIMWVPAMALLTAGAEAIGLDPGYASAYFNLSWAAGFSLGSFAGGAAAQALGDSLSYTAVAALYALSALVALRAGRRGAVAGELARS